MSVIAMQTEDLRCTLGGVEAVAGVSVSVDQGPTVGLIGPNGAGKSTLVGAIAGSRPTDTGRVLFFGEDVSRLPAWLRARRGLARTFQLSGQFARLTVLENLMVPTRGDTDDTLWGALFCRRRWATKEKRIAARAWELLDRFRMAHKGNEYAGDLSGGEKRLVEIMRGLMSKPKLLLLDEPMAGVNPSLREELTDYLESLKRDGLTMIIVEHELEVVEQLCDKVLVMANGRIVAEGRYGQVMELSDVVDAYVRG